MGAARADFPAALTGMTGGMDPMGISAGRPPGGVPWAGRAAWQGMQASLRVGLQQAGDAMSAARRQAAAVAHARDRLADLFDHLAATTCGVCPDPCCRHAKVWLDLRDLLYIHLNGEMLPPGQLRRDLVGPCRYLGRQGCTLPHRSRPWICSWYVCPGLKRALARDMPGGWRQTATLQQRVKDRRSAMEFMFLEAVALAPAASADPHLHPAAYLRVALMRPSG